MEIWLDTVDVSTIQTALPFKLFHGITTNPSLLANGHFPPDEILDRLLRVQNGPVAVQVTATTAEEMIVQGLKLHRHNPRIIVKVPVVPQGILAMRQLVEAQISVMATAIFNAQQALLALLTGVQYIAPYLSRMKQNDIDVAQELQSMIAIIERQQFKTKIIGAAVDSTDSIKFCAQIGIPALTLNQYVFEQFVGPNSLTLSSLEKFQLDWQTYMNEHPCDLFKA